MPNLFTISPTTAAAAVRKAVSSLSPFKKDSEPLPLELRLDKCALTDDNKGLDTARTVQSATTDGSVSLAVSSDTSTVPPFNLTRDHAIKTLERVVGEMRAERNFVPNLFPLSRLLRALLWTAHAQTIRAT